ncbi:cyclic nucleotide-binding domain-containing protein [Bradyrhizobium huanghuaihaiense]
MAALPSADFDLLAPELETVALLEDASISHNGDPVDYVLFPHSGAVSLMVDLADGQTVASALIGREGAIGTLSVFGPSSSALTAIVRAAGTALANPGAAISRGISAKFRDPARDPDSHQGDAGAASARRSLQCATSGASPDGTLADAHLRPH